MYRIKRIIRGLVSFCILFLCLSVYPAMSQSSSKNKAGLHKITKSKLASDDVLLTVTGEGATKEEAIKTALRSGIEQTFGTFVSANTSFVNDELIKDDIVTISSGSIKSYKEISSLTLSNGNVVVTLTEIVSVGGLTSYAQSKGVSANLSGGSFVMNMKQRELNKKNEIVVLDNLCEELKYMSATMFDKSIEIGEPRLVNDGKYTYAIDIKVNYSIGKNAKSVWDFVRNTLMSISLTSIECDSYSASNIPFYIFKCQYFPRFEYDYAFCPAVVMWPQDFRYRPTPYKKLSSGQTGYNGECYEYSIALRNDCDPYMKKLLISILSGMNEIVHTNLEDQYNDDMKLVSKTHHMTRLPYYPVMHSGTQAVYIEPDVITLLLTEDALSKLDKISIL